MKAVNGSVTVRYGGREYSHHQRASLENKLLADGYGISTIRDMGGKRSFVRLWRSVEGQALPPRMSGEGKTLWLAMASAVAKTEKGWTEA